MWNNILEAVSELNDSINSVVWGIPMLILILGTGIFMSFRTGFFQVIRAKYVSNETFLAIFKKKSVTKTKDKKAISQFQALTTALAATIGTGNIAGVATALAVGGPGAVFWMWVSAFFGMMTSFSENTLGVFYRKKNDKNEWSGGAMYYLEEGLAKKKHMKYVGKGLAIAFAIFCMLASFGIGNMTQVYSISDAVSTNFGVSPLLTGIVLAIIAGLIVIGGIKRIGSVTEKLVPFMAFAYIGVTLVIFFSNWEMIPYVFGSIFSSAFSVEAVGGGIGGYVIKRAMTMGFKRGVFSNEAGLGSAVLVNSSSDVKEPVVQGMWGIFEVFFDTIIVCTLTAFTLLSSSANALPQSQVLSNITAEEQVFAMVSDENVDDLPLVDKNYNSFAVKTDAKGVSKVHTDKPKNCEYIEVKHNGNVYYLEMISKDELTEDDYIYTNIMKVKGKEAKDENGNVILESVEFTEVNGVSLVTYAFAQRFGDIAGKLLAIAIVLFAFTTVLGWSFYGTKAVEYLFGNKATIVYKVIFVCFVVVGSTINLGLAWEVADTLNGLMAIPNLIAVLALSGTVVKITKNYVARNIKKNPEKIKAMLSAYPDIQKEQESKL